MLQLVGIKKMVSGPSYTNPSPQVTSRLMGRSFVADHLGAAFAVVEVVSDADHSC